MCYAWFYPESSIWGPHSKGQKRGSTFWFSPIDRNGTFLPTPMSDVGSASPITGRQQSGPQTPPPFPTCSPSLVRLLQEGTGSVVGLGGGFVSLADTVAYCPFGPRFGVSAVSQETWLLIPNFKETVAGVLQRCEKTNSPGLATAEQAEPVVDSATRVDTEAPKSPASRRHWSHTFMGQFQCSVLQSLAALALSRPESGPKFSRQNKTILFSRKMGGLGWRTQPLAWRLPQLATPAAKSHPLSREQEPNNTASFLLASGSAS